MNAIEGVCKPYHKEDERNFVPQTQTVVMLMKIFCKNREIGLGLTSFVQKGSCHHGYALDSLVIELCSFKWVQEAFDGSKQLASVHGVNVLEISIFSIPGVNIYVQISILASARVICSIMYA
jgi:hypothetical protein